MLTIDSECKVLVFYLFVHFVIMFFYVYDGDDDDVCAVIYSVGVFVLNYTVVIDWQVFILVASMWNVWYVSSSIASSSGLPVVNQCLSWAILGTLQRVIL